MNLRPYIDFSPQAPDFQHRLGLVGGERDFELVLGFEFVLRLNRIGRDAENLSAGFGEGGAQV